MKYRLSIIIPVLNESEYIGKLLRHLSANASKENIEEIIVVDGGSTDGTQQVVSTFEKVSLLTSPKGRPIQLNHGAKIAKGDILYFLHADTFPPKGFDQKVITEIKNNNTGCFRLKFKNPNHLLLKIAPWFTQFNLQLFRGGDQSLFITKKHFELLNGFNEQYLIYEDLEFINRIYKNYNFKIINDYVITSKRKFEKNGTGKLYFKFLMIHFKNWLGASPEDLYDYYLKHVRP